MAELFLAGIIGFAVGAYCGFQFCVWAVVRSIRNGRLQRYIADYEELFGKPEERL